MSPPKHIKPDNITYQTRPFSQSVEPEHYPAPSLRPSRQNPDIMDTNLARLWDVYQAARVDFLEAEKAPYRHDKSTAARFLRDSAENAIQYLRGKRADPIMITELQATYDRASSTAELLASGRKRKCDVLTTEGGNMPATKRSRTPIRRDERQTRGGRGGRDDNNKYERMRRHNEDVRRGFTIREQSWAAARGGDRARGPSGVPFGYSRRTVDSYTPR